jgi:hypothetical protein
MPGDKKKRPVLTEIADINDVFNTFLGKLVDALSTKTLTNTFQKVYDLAAQTTNQLGLGEESADAIRKNIAGSVEGIQKLGYDAQKAIELAQGMMVTLSQVTGKNALYNDKLFGDLQGTAKVTGIEAKTLAERFTNAGFSLESISEKMGKTLDVARASGLNGKKVSDEMSSNMSAMDKYTFQGGVDGLTKMAAQAVQMRVEMKSTLDFAERMLSPENAIDMAAALQRLGVVQSDLLDPMRLMNLSQNDPAELQRQIAEMTKGFTKLNEAGQMEILPGGREQLRAIGAELKIPYESLTNMARSGVELESKMAGIKFPEMATEEQKTLIANMTRLNDKGKFVIAVNGVDENLDDYMAKISENGEINKDMLKQLEPKTVEKLAQEQLTQLELLNTTIGTIGVSKSLGMAVASSTINAAKIGQDIGASFAKILRELGGGSTREITEKRDDVSVKTFPTKAELDKFPETFPKALFDLNKGGQQLDIETAKLPEPFNIVIGELTNKLTLLGVGIGSVLSEISKKIKKQRGFDFIRTEDGDIDFFEKDTIFAGTGGDKIAKMIKGDISPMSNGMETSSTIKDINPINTNGDIIQMISKGLNIPTKELENMTKNSTTNETSNENKVVIEVRVSTSNDNINPDLNQKIVDVVTQAFKDDMGLKQVVATSIKDVVTNGSRPS